MSTSAPTLRTAGHLLRVAGGAALAAVAVAGAAALLLVGVGPHTGAYRTLTVLSGSMRPVVDPGDVVVVRPVPTGELRVGDVIVFSAPTPDRATVTHRIIEIVEPGPAPVVRTKGDGNSAADPWQARLAPGTGWRVAFVVPVIGRAINVLSRPDVRRIVSVAMPAGLAMAWLASVVGGLRVREDDGAAPAPAPGLPAAPRAPRPRVRVVLAVTGACLGIGVLMAAAGSPAKGRSR